MWVGFFLPIIAISLIVWHTPAWLEPHTLTVTLAPEQTLTLGHDLLGIAHTDQALVRLHRTRSGDWQLTDIGTSKRVWWRGAGQQNAQLVREWPLTAGAQFTVSAQTVTVLAADTDHIILETAGDRFEYAGRQLQRADRTLSECVPHWRSQWHNTLGMPQRPLRLGGAVSCADRLGLVDVPIDAAVIVPTPSGFVLRQGPAAINDPITVATGTSTPESLAHRTVLLSIGDHFLIHSAEYWVQQTTPDLVLTLHGRLQRRLTTDSRNLTEKSAQLHFEPMAWVIPRNGWLIFYVGLWGCGAVCLFLWKPWGQIAILLGLAVLHALMYLNIHAVPPLLPYALTWIALSLWIGTVRSRWSGVLLMLFALLLGTGLVTLLQLGAGSPDAGWMRCGSSNAALAGAFGWLMWLLHGLWQRWPFVLTPRSIRWMIRLHSGSALIVLALQAIFGDETGWYGFQPFEWVKLALVFATANALSVLTCTQRAFCTARVWPHVLKLTLLLLGSSAFALVLLHDFSPLVLLSLWIIVSAGAWVCVHPQWRIRWSGGMIWLLLVTTITVAVVQLHDHPEDFPRTMTSDRLRVWASPEQYPQSGYQIRRALEFIRAGGAWGHVWHEPLNGRVMAIPVIESDFAPAFFLNRFGSIAGMLLVGLQTLFVVTLLWIAHRAFQRTRRFAYFALCGGAAFVGGHCFVSWGTNLGFLPVMGQPMPFLSVAGSHLVLFVLPIVALAVAVEETSDVEHR